MNPSGFFIRRPVATTLLMLAVVLCGAIGFYFLPVSSLPEVDYPTIQVQTFLPGASPEVMTASVTAPLERQLGEMPGLKQMTSSSAAGVSLIVLQFGLDIRLDVAEQEAQAAINAAASFLPADLPAPPVYAKVNPADAPILTIALTSGTLPLNRLEDLAETRLAQKISQLPGVGLVTLSSGARPTVRVQADLRALAAHGLNLDDLRSIIGNNNVNAPKGSVEGPMRSYTIRANDQLLAADEYGKIVIAYRNGSPVRLSDVAQVIDDVENQNAAAWYNGSRAILVNVQRQPGANVIAVVDRIKDSLPAIRAALPPSLEVGVVADRTVSIRASVAAVESELCLAVALVVLVIFLFLRNLRATLIPSLAVPVSLVGTFAFVHLAGFSINNLTLMALTIATGFVVDDAIVMIENIARFGERGFGPLAAALTGSRQIFFTVVSLTVSLIAVLIPLLFMGDVLGRLFREFAITLAVTVVISAVVSLTLVPMLCARLLRHRPESRQGAAARWLHHWFDALIAAYGRCLDWVLPRRSLTLGVLAGTLAATVALLVVMPKGFLPTQDLALIQGVSTVSPGTPFRTMAERQEALAAIIARDADVEGVSSFIGVDGTNVTANEGRFLIRVKPGPKRSAPLSDVMARFKQAAASISGVSLFLQPVQDLTVGSTTGRSQYQFVLEEMSPGEAGAWVPKLLERLRQLPQLEDVSSNVEEQAPSAYLEIDRDTAARFGITLATIDNALYDAFGQRIVSTIFTQSNQYRVILESLPSSEDALGALNNLYFPSALAAGGQVPLSAIAHISERPAPLRVDHLGRFPAATFSFNLTPGVALGDAVSAIKRATRDIGLPGSILTRFQGATLAFESSLSNEIALILAAIVVVYIVLGILYESFLHPVTILSTLPSAGLGALVALLLAREDLGVIGIIGLVLLIGIVKKNAIMMIDFALEAERVERKSPREAIRQACLLRFRPIMMTTFAALAGALPLVLGSGVGSELRRPLGIALIGGLLVSQLLTLFTTPVVYLALDRFGKRVRERPPAAAAA